MKKYEKEQNFQKPNYKKVYRDHENLRNEDGSKYHQSSIKLPTHNYPKYHYETPSRAKEETLYEGNLPHQEEFTPLSKRIEGVEEYFKSCLCSGEDYIESEASLDHREVVGLNRNYTPISDLHKLLSPTNKEDSYKKLNNFEFSSVKPVLFPQNDIKVPSFYENNPKKDLGYQIPSGKISISRVLELKNQQRGM